MDIDGLGERLIRLLADNDLLHDVADLYLLRSNDLMALPGLAEKSSDNLVAAIAASRDRPLAQLIAALGIRGIGATVAATLAERFDSLEALALTDEEDLADVPGVGPVGAANIAAFFAQERTQALIGKLHMAGVSTDARASGRPGGALAGKAVVLTGTLPTMSRAEASKLIKSAGGRVSGSVSGRTDWVVAGQNPGSKLKRAQELGIPIIGEAELRTLATEGGEAA
jgi:DNA ligase (NAD+)